MFRFEKEIYLYILFAIPLFTIIFVIVRIARKKALSNFAETELLNKLIPNVSKYKATFKFAILMIALALIILGVANPELGTKLENIKREGVEVMIALDVSNSMLAEDIKPSRLERAKQSINKLIDQLSNDKIGIVVFAGESFLQLPITTDYSAAKLLLSTVDVDMIGTQGTAIGSAIEMAKKSFDMNNRKVNKVLIIITDGENHEDDALGKASEISKDGVIVHTIGMGSIKGSPIPIFNNGNRSDFIRDRSGEIVITKLNADALQQIAAAGNGKFIRSGTTDPDLGQLIKEINKLDKTQFETKQFTDFETKFQYFLFAGLLLLIAELFLTEEKNKMIGQLVQLVGGKQK